MRVSGFRALTDEKQKLKRGAASDVFDRRVRQKWLQGSVFKKFTTFPEFRESRNKGRNSMTSLELWTYSIVGVTFALYIGIAVWA
ncbi:MAG: hypothetical protein EOM26_13545, partial [Alphaproteobacteria bacterium]|nr:hypothetical protein [Alphaproteobacteria bacterium]